MKVLITGGAGFLGLHLAYYLSKAAQTEEDSAVNQLLLLDMADFEKNEYPKNVHFVKGDVRDRKLITEATKKVDFIVHAAAALPLWKKEEIFDINVGGTENILEASVKNKIKRVVFISSTAVYGVPKKKPADLNLRGLTSPMKFTLSEVEGIRTSEVKNDGIKENDPLVGVGSYGESKIQAEKLCRKFRKKSLVVAIIRPKTFVGSHRLGVFEILFDWIKDGKRIPVIGSGKNRYQLLDVEDLAEAIYLCLTTKNAKKVNHTFNIGAEEFGTVKEDLEKLFDYANSGSTILPTPAFLVKKALSLFEKLKLSPLYQWVYDTADKDSYVSIKKIKKALNWKPKYSNAEALIKAYQWYLDNYKELKSKTPGITHTVGWDQGILKLIKKLM